MITGPTDVVRCVDELSSEDRVRMALLVLAGYKFKGAMGNLFRVTTPDGSPLYIGQLNGNPLPNQIEKATQHSRGVRVT